MRRFNTFFSSIVMKFMNMKIVKKMILCYIIVFFVPVILLGILYYVNMMKDVQYKYVTNKQQILEQAYSNFKSLSSQIEYVYPLLQHNNFLIDYVSGYYTNASDEVYDYLTQIDPLFMTILMENSLIEELKIYRYEDSFINPGYYIDNIKNFKGDLKMLQRSLNPDKGIWTLTKTGNSAPIITYYMKMYDKKYLKELGIIEIVVRSNVLLQSFNILESNEQLILQTKNDYYLLDPHFQDIMTPIDPSARTFNSIKNSSNSLVLSEFNAKLFLITSAKAVPGKSLYTFLIFIVSLLILLSLIYYAIISSVVNRIIKLTRHIRNVETDRLVQFEGTGYKDEVGALVHSFNKMIRRISELIRTVYESELQKKEAEYYALQSQMKPHFLFNSLETIRMHAEMNKDISTADMLCSLGKYVRYNISNNGRQTCLLDEIEHIINYFKIYKGRLGMSFDYYIDLPKEFEKNVCPKFILQPAVENCIVHGFKNVTHKRDIRIVIREEESVVTASITDNGNGIPEERLTVIGNMLENRSTTFAELENRKGSIGILNVNERLKMFYDDDTCGLSLHSRPGEGTTCILRLGKAVS